MAKNEAMGMRPESDSEGAEIAWIQHLLINNRQAEVLRYKRPDASQGQ